MLPALLLLPVSAAAGPDFVGSYAPANWLSTGITGGAAGVDVSLSTDQELVLYCDVDLGYPGPGVTYREAEYVVIADADGEVTFAWDFTYDARIYMPRTELHVFVEGPGGRAEAPLVIDVASFGSETATGLSPILVVNAGYPFGIRMGGSNLDSESRISGELILSDFVVDEVDCNGVAGGSAVEDSCGVCDSDPGNDCVRDCNGVWGGAAVQDMCGACDSDPGNDCEQDCDGVWGGTAVEDNCGTCDSNPANDCAQDCNGVFGGSAELDDCGVCDRNPANDCEQDCNGDWGGSAYTDSCGDCVGGGTGQAPCATTAPADTDTDTEPDTDTDTDADSDTDTDTDTDTDADSDTDTDAPVDTGGLQPPDLGDTEPGDPVTYNRAGRSCGCASVSAPAWGPWLQILSAGWARRR